MVELKIVILSIDPLIGRIGEFNTYMIRVKLVRLEGRYRVA